VAAALILVLLAGRVSAQEPEPESPRLVAIDAPGAMAFTAQQIRNILRLKLDAPLFRDPTAIARSLEIRYQDEGYPAARVSGAFDPATGTLTLSVDEGRLLEVTVKGLEGGAAAQAVRAAGLQPGGVLRSADIDVAFGRLEEASAGALTPGSYALERDAEGGVRLSLEPMIERRVKVSPRFSLNRASGRINRVDGFAFPIGAEITIRDRRAYNHTVAYGVPAYGWSSHDWRYAVGVSRPFGPGGPVTLGYEYHDMTDSDDLFRLVGVDEARGASVSTEIGREFFKRQGHEAYAFARLSKKAQLGVTFRSDDYTSLPVTNGSSEANPEIDAGLSRSLIGTLRFSSAGPLFERRSTERHSLLQRSLYGLFHEVPRQLRSEATFEWASADTLGGDFSFRRLLVNTRYHLPLGPRHDIEARLLLGVAGGETPRQKRLALGGTGTLRGYAFKAFTGDSMALTTLEYSVKPGRQIPRLSAFYDGGQMWRNAPDERWKSDVGIGLRWPPNSDLFVRVDFARAVFDKDETRIRTLGRLQIPF